MKVEADFFEGKALIFCGYLLALIGLIVDSGGKLYLFFGLTAVLTGERNILRAHIDSLEAKFDHLTGQKPRARDSVKE